MARFAVTLVLAVALLSSGSVIKRVSVQGDHGQGQGVLVTMYSDAQCPCSAQFVSDIKHILDHHPFNATGPGTTGAEEDSFRLDFEQYFVPKCMDAIDTCKVPETDYLKARHAPTPLLPVPSRCALFRSTMQR